MASTLAVDNIVGRATAANVHITGTLVQRQSTKSSTEYTNSTQTFSDVTGTSLTFTPKFASSLLLIKYYYSINVYTSGTNTNAGGMVRLVHDGTSLDYTGGNYEHYYQNDAGSGTGPNSYARAVKLSEVSATNTNARVIKAQARIYASPTVAIRINQGNHYTSYLVVEEIAQ
tara:strand:- start:455 stop:970 length:516 start_codon:yes stop_codon:yes gene_type:complete